jgi:hypothetical protein
MSGTDALAATLLYRLVSFWLPLPAGAIAYVAFRREYRGLRGFRTASAGSPIPAGHAESESGTVKRTTGR